MTVTFNLAITVCFFVICLFSVTTSTSTRNINVLPEDAVRVVSRPFFNWYVPGSGRWIGHLTYPPDWCRANGLEAISNLLLYHPYLTLEESTTIWETIQDVERKQGKDFFVTAEYFDDILWWCLAYTRAYELALSPSFYNLDLANSFLTTAMNIHDVVTQDSCTKDDVCGANGCYWSRTSNYKNAITNELYLTAAARLARLARTPEEEEIFLSRAENSISWFLASGLIQSSSTFLVIDGLTSACQLTGGIYTYNQGVLLSGFAEFSLISPEKAAKWSLWSIAEKISMAGTTLLAQTDTRVLLEDSCGDGALFKGIFTRYIRYFLTLSQKVPATSVDNDTSSSYISEKVRLSLEEFLEIQSKAIWNNAIETHYQTEFVDKKWTSSSTKESGREKNAGLQDNMDDADFIHNHNTQIAAIDGFTSAFHYKQSTTSTNIVRRHFSTVDNVDCSGHGYLVRTSASKDKNIEDSLCVCFTRYTGENCETETVAWSAFYANNNLVFSSAHIHLNTSTNASSTNSFNYNMQSLLCRSNSADKKTLDATSDVTTCVADDDLANRAAFSIETMNTTATYNRTTLTNVVKLRVWNSSMNEYLAVVLDTITNTLQVKIVASMDTKKDNHDTHFSIIINNSSNLNNGWMLEEVSLFSVVHQVFIVMKLDISTQQVSVTVAADKDSSAKDDNVVTNGRFLANLLQYCK